MGDGDYDDAIVAWQNTILVNVISTHKHWTMTYMKKNKTQNT